MTREQIADFTDDELDSHIRRVQQLDFVERELSELLSERRRRQIAAALPLTEAIFQEN